MLRKMFALFLDKFSEHVLKLFEVISWASCLNQILSSLLFVSIIHLTALLMMSSSLLINNDFNFVEQPKDSTDYDENKGPA